MDGKTMIGLVTEVTRDTFVIHVMDSIYNQNAVETGEGIMIESMETIKEIDWKFSEQIYMTEMVCSIEADVSHKLPVEALHYYNLMSPFLYDTVKTREVKKNPAKKLNKKSAKKPLDPVDSSKA